MKVEIYTKPHCPYCERAKELLRIKGVAFIEYVINGGPLRAEDLPRRGTPQTLPEIIIDDRLIGGCADLFDLDESGELDRLLAASSESPR